jgi:hypothetical protein
MAEIYRYSLLYDMAEDRIAWDTIDREGATTRLWLTQRLSRDLVAALLPMLQTALPPPEQPRLPQHQAAVQSFEQAAAMTSFGRTPGVVAAPGATAGLVRKVHLKPNAQGVDLTFEFAMGQTRTIGSPHESVRQTLTIFRRLWAAAGWPMDIWPHWMAEEAAALSGGAVN